MKEMVVLKLTIFFTFKIHIKILFEYEQNTVK